MNVVNLSAILAIVVAPYKAHTPRQTRTFQPSCQFFLITCLKMVRGIFNKAFLYGANVIKLFTAVICCHSTVIPSFCVIKLFYQVISVE
jgi:hypothetical protein